MGLFSKKTYVCEKCGKTYEKRINLNGNLCEACWKMEQDRRDELKNENKGYNYYMDVRYKEYSSDEMEEIVKHKNVLLEKFQLTDGISRAELQQASDNYRSLTDEEAVDVLARVARTSMCNTMGAAYTDSFFAPTGYESTIVDAEDVFAVGFTSDYRLKGNNEEVILCAVFTNDPYISVFPMVYLGKRGMFELMSPKSAKMLENIGYLQETEVSKIMRLDKMLNRRYWNKQLKK